MSNETTTTTDADDFSPLGDATYCPEDNKLRFYSYSRFSNEIKDRIKSAGFKWAPKQECWVAPAWTPSREDLLIELCGEIGDEDYSPEERAADRAERFEGYREKRAGEAGDFADTFEAGPQAFGHQNAARAERQARRHDRLRGKAVNQWSKAEYWTERTAAVIKHALHKSSAPVRRERILRLEAELRTRCYSERWEQHYRLRLTYENAMLEQEGGKAADIEMVVGGFIRSHQIHKVNKSPVTGRVVSVQVWGMKGKIYHYNRERVPGLVTINIERAGTDIGYRPPTPEELEAFHAARKAEKAEAKKTAPKAPSLINPTEEDAQRLQDLWNRMQDAKQTRTQYPYRLKKSAQTPRPMTQAEYSERSKGAYSHFETESICLDGFKPRTHYGEAVPRFNQPRHIACKIRTAPYSGTEWDYVHRVVIITDKPQKPLPIDWEAAEQAIPRDPFFEAWQQWTEEEAPKRGGIKFASQIYPDDDTRRVILVDFHDGTEERFRPKDATGNRTLTPFEQEFATWAKAQTEIHGDLIESRYRQDPDTKRDEFFFRFSDGTCGNYGTYGVGYYRKAEQPAASEEKFTLSAN